VLLCLALPAGRAAALVDITGTWKFTLQHPDIVGTLSCSATINQENDDTLTAPMTCDFFGSGTLTGAVDANNGAFILTGNLGPNPMTMSGQSALDGNSASGIWTVSPVPANGTFTAIRTGGGPAVGGLTELADVTHPGASHGLPMVLWLFGAAAGAAALGGMAVLHRGRRAESR
jgi:hypothetical protein